MIEIVAARVVVGSKGKAEKASTAARMDALMERALGDMASNMRGVCDENAKLKKRNMELERELLAREKAPSGRMEESERVLALRTDLEKAESEVAEAERQERDLLQQLHQVKFRISLFKDEAALASKKLRCFESEEREHENNEKLLRLPLELWRKIVENHVDENHLFAFASTCKFFREIQKELSAKKEGEGKKELRTDLWKMKEASAAYLRWVYDTKPKYYGTTENSSIVRLAASGGHLQLLQWLKSGTTIGMLP